MKKIESKTLYTALPMPEFTFFRAQERLQKQNDQISPVVVKRDITACKPESAPTSRKKNR